MKFIFWALASHGLGLSGGDRIYIEFSKRWSKEYPVNIISWQEGVSMMARNGLVEGKNISIEKVFIPHIIQSNFLLCYIFRIITGVVKSLFLKISNPENTYLYSASEFWMDSIPCWVLKLRFPRIKWIATWFQTAPSPLVGYSSGRYRLSVLYLWLSQLPIKPIFAKFADFVLVNNDLEKKVFPKSKTLVVLGAVNTSEIELYLQSHFSTRKKYTAVFQGRFHPQKGVVELLDIWHLVVTQQPKAKLAMIGDGPLMPTVREHIANLGLANNIDLLGYILDGPHKYKIFSSSQIAVHPAFYDSGGMATAEAMAFGLPAIGFNLQSYDSYYPQGMLKVPLGDLEAFAQAIIDLSNHPLKRNQLGKQAKRLIYKSSSWDFRSNQILLSVISS